MTLNEGMSHNRRGILGCFCNQHLTFDSCGSNLGSFRIGKAFFYGLGELCLFCCFQALENQVTAGEMELGQQNRREK